MRSVIIAELDVVSLYEQLAKATDNEAIRTMLLDVDKEEKHLWTNSRPCCSEDEEQGEELKHGKS